MENQNFMPNTGSINPQLFWAYVDPQDFILGPNHTFGTALHKDKLEEERTMEESFNQGAQSRRSQQSSKQSSKAFIPKIPIA